MAVFFTSDGCASRLVLNERDLSEEVPILENINLSVFDLDPILTVRLLFKKYEILRNLHLLSATGDHSLCLALRVKIGRAHV